jgi:hypothetical protein
MTAGGRTSDATITRAVFVRRLLDLGYRHGDIAIYGSGEWELLPAGDPRRFAAVVRSAECWYQEGTDDAIRARLIQELADNDMLARYRIRQAGLDVWGSPTGGGDLGETSGHPYRTANGEIAFTRGRPFTWSDRVPTPDGKPGLTSIDELKKLRRYGVAS